MCDLSSGDEVRYLPCLHTFHRTCIDDWLMRCFSCPSCLQPLEPELLGPSSGISGFGGGLIVSGVDRISSNPNSFNQPGLSPLKAIMIPSSQTSGFDSVSVDSARLTTLADEQLLIDISPYASAAVTQGSSATPPSFPPPLSSTLSLTPSQKPASHPLLSESDFSGQQAGQSDVN
ncbi:unnamed protein product [Protopolystoma xenopodis]|uniref:RING-type domain-containing protein n=1 Tax=Protopolystoma xenopodis TaxID=117903 RepID=A0A448X665_9PLAT|nr:unnamed protein product [Protopolystoma xenopodis]